MINGGDVVRPENNRSVISEWENLKDCGRCGSCPLKDVRALSSRGAKTGRTSEAEKIVGAKAQGGQPQCSQGTAKEICCGGWEVRMEEHRARWAFVSWSNHLQ